MDSLYFSQDERQFFERVIEEGLHQSSGGKFWWVVRIAIAQSLKLEGIPDARYGATPIRDRGSEIHLPQVTGLGQQPDYDAAMRLLLSVKHGEDLFDTKSYIDQLQRHARRGLEVMQAAWAPGRSFHDYLLDELYFNLDGAGGEAPAGGALDWEALARGLDQIGVRAEPVGEAQDGPRLTRFSLVLGAVDDYDRLRRGLEDLSFAVGLASGGLSVSREAGERRVVLDVPRPSATWRDVPWSSIRSALSDRSELLPVSPGVDIMGRPMVFDLIEAPHLFVAGATGSGKSVCLNALLLSMLASRAAPELVLIDPKGVDFADYEGCHRLRDRKVITDMGEAVTTLRRLVEEMETRSQTLREYGARNIAEAQAAGASMRRLIVVIDELADFMMGKSGAEEPLVRLAQKARAGGIHLVLATQRPEAATFPGLLRANIPSRIALTVQKATDSRIILDEGGAELLLMRGDMLVKLAGRDPTRAHGARVESADIRAAVAAANSQ